MEIILRSRVVGYGLFRGHVKNSRRLNIIEIPAWLKCKGWLALEMIF